FADVLARHRTVMAVEAANFHGERLKRHPEDYGPNITRLLTEGFQSSALEYAQAKQLQTQLRDEAEPWFSDFDQWLLPATTCAAPDKATTGDPAFNSPWSFTGLPVVSIPAGRSPDGLPLSVQLVGATYWDRSLFQAAAWCEKVLAQPLLDPLNTE